MAKRIYIASSWKNQHAVEMLTHQLRVVGYEVISWVENNYGENHNHVTKQFDFETWVNTKESDQSFEFDVHGAMTCDIFIYIGPSGKDAAAECGMCYGQRLAGKTIPMYALWAKGEDFGLMRKMFDWYFDRYQDLVKRLEEAFIADVSPNTIYVGEQLEDFFGSLFASDSPYINRKLPVRQAMELLFNAHPNMKRYLNVIKFKDSLKAWCTYKGLQYNPSRKGHTDDRIRDGDLGLEYVEVGNANYNACESVRLKEINY